jgi:hypothetical protein
MLSRDVENVNINTYVGVAGQELMLTLTIYRVQTQAAASTKNTGKK